MPYLLQLSSASDFASVFSDGCLLFLRMVVIVRIDGADESEIILSQALSSFFLLYFSPGFTRMTQDLYPCSGALPVSRKCLRTRLHKHMRADFRQILPQTALKILAGRKPACGFLPTLQQNYAR
ncbi:MAG: hypothetical protein KH357_10950, partial [Clostridiales bacterium]|nr:hypothetical protein [Clostridiales bacterium]